MKVSFSNRSMNRELSREDFSRLGVDDDLPEGYMVSWNARNNFSVELPDDVAQKLIDTYPGEFMPTPDPEDEESGRDPLRGDEQREVPPNQSPPTSEQSDSREERPDASKSD